MISEKNIVLTGFMGAGKTLLAQELARLLSREALSMDHLIEARERMPIAEIFALKGEPYFRAAEKRLVAEISRRSSVIIDCGGGVVLQEENVRHLKSNGIIFYLSAAPEEIYRRVREETHRPLLAVPDPLTKIKELLARRASFYERAADVVIVTDQKSPQEICSEIIDQLDNDGTRSTDQP